MTEIIVMGHGAYAAGTKENVDMIVGVPKNMRFLDLRGKWILRILKHGWMN